MSVELADIARFLSGTAPFDVLDDAALQAIVVRLNERYFRRGEVIISPGQPGDSLFVIRSGGVEILDSDGVLLDTRDVGECFGNSTINGTGPSRYRMVAAADTLAVVVPKAVMDDVSSRFSTVREFFDAQTMAVRQTALDSRLADSGGEGGALQVGELLGRSAVTVSRDTSIRASAETMTAARVSSLLVVESDGALAGILTDRDLRTRVLAAGAAPSAPVETVMTADPFTVPDSATVFDAALEMMDRGINHLPVVSAAGDIDDRVRTSALRPCLMGVVTSTDLVRVSNADPIFLAGRIARANSVTDVARNTQRLPDLIVGLARHGVQAEQIGRIYTAAMDAATRRLIRRAEEKLGQAPLPVCWVAVGSQARRELGLSSDQDNALILGREPNESDNAYLVEFTRQVNRDLAEIGLPRCPGLVEASNPAWRKTPEQWVDLARTWAGQPESQQILEAQIFFDMRPVAGDISLFETTRSGMLAAGHESPRFHAHLAHGAAQWQPPLGFFRGLVVKRRGEHRNTLDIKAGGISAVVQIARLVAIAHGLAAVSTEDRLHAAQASGALQAEDAHVLLSAFQTLRRLQLQHHVRCVQDNREPDNHIDPTHLSAWDRRDLRQAFTAVSEHLTALGLRYPLRQM